MSRVVPACELMLQVMLSKYPPPPSHVAAVVPVVSAGSPVPPGPCCVATS